VALGFSPWKGRALRVGQRHRVPDAIFAAGKVRVLSRGALDGDDLVRPSGGFLEGAT